MPQFPNQCGPVEKPFGLGLGRQQELNLGAKTGIAAAGLVEERLAAHEIRHIQRGAEDLSFSQVCRIHGLNGIRAKLYARVSFLAFHLRINAEFAS